MTKSADDILPGLAAIIAEETGGDPSEITADTQLVGELDLDSLDLMSVFTHAEDEFKVRLDYAEARDCATVGDLVVMIVEALSYP